jgi:transcriptional antiterminator NusG
VLPTRIPLPEWKRNVVPNTIDGLSWYACTTMPQAELRAARSLRREADRLAEWGLQPLVPYAPCSTRWRQRHRGALKLPDLEVQTPLLRSYLFVGVLGGIEDGHLGVMSERDAQQQNKHGLLAVLGQVQERKPVALDEAAVAFLSKLAGEERTDPDMPVNGQKPPFQAGQAVRLSNGPLQGFGATVEAVDAMKARMLVSVSMFGRMSQIELNWCEAVAA